MQPSELSRYISKSMPLIERTLRKLRPELMQHYGVIEHEKKQDNSSLTALDTHTEEVLRQAIDELGFDAGFYGEEFGISGNTDTFWTIDPIDGTEAFIRGMPFCSNMLCLISKGEIQASVIYNFPLDEMFIAIKGKGARCNGKRISVSDRGIEHASIEFEIRPITQKSNDIYFKLPRYSKVKFAAAGFGFCQVAKGAIEARIQYDGYGKLWDYAPGALLVQEAGGTVANIGKTEFDWHNLDFIASNRRVHGDLQEFFKNEVLSK